jgi:hypothetical protein
MNWEAVAAIGDLIGAVGVIVTLAYLAVQIRRNTLATYANSYQTYADSIIGNNLTIARSKDSTCNACWGRSQSTRGSRSASSSASKLTSIV